MDGSNVGGMSSAISPYAPGVEPYGQALRVQAFSAARAAQAAQPPAWLEARSELRREPGLEEEPDAEPSHEPRSLRYPEGAIEERSTYAHRPGDLVSYSTAFLTQFIAQALRPSAEGRIDVLPHEGFAVYRLASERGIAYFGILDPIDFAV